MTRHLPFLFATLLVPALALAEEPGPEGQAPAALAETLAALDTAAFDAFNRCNEPGQLDRHAAFFSPSVEFYHDNGGVTWNRDAMIGNTAKYVCGNFRRELVPGTLRVYPVKDFGAITQGVHRFCQFDDGSCEGMAEFVMIWRQDGERWEITRVLSYGHRAAAPAASP